DHGLLAGRAGGDEERLQALADRRVGAGDEPIGRLHHVRVGVVIGAALGVRHGAPPLPSSRPEAGAVARGAAMRALGVDLGGTKIEGVVLDEALRPLHRVRVETERARGYDHILDRVAEVVAALRPHAPEARLVGIGTPGSLSARDGTLKNSNTTCLNGRPLHADMEARLAMPVRLENDANCFALAEARHGAGRGHEVVFGVILGTGVGGGIVVRGELWSGPQHIAGEWGHHAIDPAGPECYCGRRGCVETMLSGPALEARYRAAGGGALPAAEIAVRA